jgi:RNA-splicing ligase RtcB
MKIVQKFAVLNRKAMVDEIVNKMHFTIEEQFTTIHNFIDTEAMILRKGAIFAKLGKKVLIPINMADGSLVCIGKGNEDWNYSAPHGAGRLMSRSKAKEMVSMNEYKESMKNVWSTSVCEGTIDESPMAYKPIEEIIDNIKETVDIVNIIKPLYNFKAN